ncbi:MAG: hypothetical protein KA408_12710 [Flavobacteriales bacterium]|nr:hypothetical protein [Flavobacteriales bacterium]
MSNATGPWQYPPALPKDPKKLCLVKVKNFRTEKNSFYVLRYLRGNWQFQDRLLLSGDEDIVSWAEITE